MTVATILTSVPNNQNAAGYPPVPTPTVVNAGAPVARWVGTLTVTPSSAWAKASLMAGPDGVNFDEYIEVYVAPNGTGTNAESRHSPPAGKQYFTGEITGIAPGATATLTVTY